MSQQHLNLLKVATGGAAQLRTYTPQVVGSDSWYAGDFSVIAKQIPDGLVFASAVGLSNEAIEVPGYGTSRLRTDYAPFGS